MRATHFWRWYEQSTATNFSPKPVMPQNFVSVGEAGVDFDYAISGHVSSLVSRLPSAGHIPFLTQFTGIARFQAAITLHWKLQTGARRAFRHDRLTHICVLRLLEFISSFLVGSLVCGRTLSARFHTNRSAVACYAVVETGCQLDLHGLVGAFSLVAFVERAQKRMPLRTNEMNAGQLSSQPRTHTEKYTHRTF